MTTNDMANYPVQLIVGPPGSGKSFLIRAYAVKYVTEYLDKVVVILVPRHKLGDEQIAMLREEHPNGKYNAAVWRSRHADNPHDRDPDKPGKFRPMCLRQEDLEKVEMQVLEVEPALCKRGKGGSVIKCSLYDTCAFQAQKQIVANIWFGAHELAAHEMRGMPGEMQRMVGSMPCLPLACSSSWTL
jgi:hypothetical protein